MVKKKNAFKTQCGGVPTVAQWVKNSDIVG